jgi:hypothetical protein
MKTEASQTAPQAIAARVRGLMMRFFIVWVYFPFHWPSSGGSDERHRVVSDDRWQWAAAADPPQPIEHKSVLFIR